MEPLKAFGRSRLMTALLGSGTLALTVLIISHPDEAFAASLGGLRLWWTMLVPGLLPFYILVEIAAGFGLLRAFGSLFEPLLRLLLRTPPGSGEALASGLMNGYPFGAEAVLRLSEQGQLDRDNTGKLLALTHLCNPALMVTVIGAGFLHSVRAGVFIAFIHYLSAFAAVLLLHATKSQAGPMVTGPGISARRPKRRRETGFLLSLQQGREEDGRTFGQLLGVAVSKAVQWLFTMSGYIILFSVVCRMLSLLLPADLPGVSLLPALLEPHIGSYAAAIQGEAGIQLYAIIGAALAWSGLTQHVQVGGLLPRGQFRYGIFLLGRSLHAGFAYVLTYAVGVPFLGWLSADPTVLAPVIPSQPVSLSTADAAVPSLWSNLLGAAADSFAFLLMTVALMALLAVLLLPLVGRLKNSPGRNRP